MKEHLSKSLSAACLLLGLAACRVEITTPPEGGVQINGPLDSFDTVFCAAGSTCLVELNNSEEDRFRSIDFFAQPTDPSTHVHVGWKRGDDYICGEDSFLFRIYGNCSLDLRGWGDEQTYSADDVFNSDLTLKLEPIFAPIGRVGGDDFATALPVGANSKELFVSKAGGGCDYFAVNLDSGGYLFATLMLNGKIYLDQLSHFDIWVVDILQNRFQDSAALQPGLQHVLICTPQGSGRMPYELELRFSQSIDG